MQEEKLQEALDYFNKDLKDNPKNGYAYSWIAMLRGQNEEYGRALTAADMAIKYLPKKDAEYVIFAYTTRAGVYLHLGDTAKAMNDYNLAIKVKPDEGDLYDKRAQIYFEQGKYELAAADYRKMIELKPGDVMGYMGLGRNANEQKNWDEAIKQFDYRSAVIHYPFKTGTDITPVILIVSHRCIQDLRAQTDSEMYVLPIVTVLVDIVEREQQRFHSCIDRTTLSYVLIRVFALFQCLYHLVAEICRRLDNQTFSVIHQLLHKFIINHRIKCYGTVSSIVNSDCLTFMNGHRYQIWQQRSVSP